MRFPLHREPLIHFLVLGGLIFAAFAVIHGAPVGDPRKRLEVTEAQTASLTRRFEATWRRPPSPAELSELIDRGIREEVLVREALALALDRDDAVIRQRLVEKMQFLIESRANAATPTEPDLRAHFERNRDRFAVAPSVAFEQLQLDPGAADAEKVLAAVRAGADPGRFGQTTPLPRSVPPVSRPVVDGAFGAGFFDRLTGLEVGRWSGPVASAQGSHLIRVTLLEPGRPRSFDEAREAVEKDWRATIAQKLYASLRAGYDVRRADTGRMPVK